MKRALLILILAATLGSDHCRAANITREQPSSPTPALPVFGRVLWADRDLADTCVRIFEDPALKRLLKVHSTSGKRGSFATYLEPGTYYFMAFSDQDGDGRAGSGDGIGFFGVTVPTARPAPLRIGPRTTHLTINIPISFQIADDGHSLKPLFVQPPPVAMSAESISATGRIDHIPDNCRDAFILFRPVDSDLPPLADRVSDSGTFELSIPPAKHHVLAIADTNASEVIDAGDRIGMLGYRPPMADYLPVLRFTPEPATADMTLSLRWVLDARNRMRTPDGMALGPILNVATLPAIVTGTILRDGRPVPDAAVEAFADSDCRRLWYHTTTGADGRYCLAMLPATYYLKASASGRSSDAETDAAAVGHFAPPAAKGNPGPQPFTLQPAHIYTATDISLGPASTPHP